ncbi:MAG: exopolyphosphatase, partial [Acidimicrobiales bacterium]
VPPGQLETVARESHITRMGQDVDATGVLHRDAIGRVVERLQSYREILDQHQVESLRMSATSAARDARNREDLFDLVEAVMDSRPELISGDEEAHLSFAGATAGLDPSRGPFLVIDIGGGSTEFAYGLTSCDGAISTDMGAVRLTEKFIEHDPVRPEELVACLSMVELYLDDVVASIPLASSATTLVGVAGTVTTTAAVELGLEPYDRDRIHHFELSKSAVEDVFRTLATETRDERLANPGMVSGRVDVIVAGVSILAKTMRQLDFANCLVSESDILDGLVMSQL